jgi:hypothetical protein
MHGDKGIERARCAFYKIKNERQWRDEIYLPYMVIKLSLYRQITATSSFLLEIVKFRGPRH